MAKVIKVPEFDCAGPIPTGYKLREYRAKQREAIEVLAQLNYSVQMGLVTRAQNQAVILTKIIKDMQACLKP